MNFCSVGFFLLFVLSPQLNFAQSLADAVNPLVGTAAQGQTFPGVGIPFGMTQWTPSTQNSQAKGIVPYFYDDREFYWIRGTHFLSGSATQDYGSFQLLAGSGKFVWDGHAPSSRFSHDAEHATPYLYEVELPDLGVSASVTGNGALRPSALRLSRQWRCMDRCTE